MKLIILFRKPFTIESLDYYLNELAKDYLKLTKKNKVPIEVVIVGGASILINYGFRNSTNDVDAILSWGFLEQSIKNISQKFELDKNWLNSDFKQTKSFTPKLIEFSTFYKCYQRTLNVRTVKSEYLIAMKMVSGRVYKNDLSDIVGILLAEQQNGNTINKEKIEKSIYQLYGSLRTVHEDIYKSVYRILNKGNLNEIYKFYLESEKNAKEQMLQLRNLNDNILVENDFTDFSDIFMNIFNYEDS